jgi:CubicO group peptidase (beta-lactamase class C family)
MLTWKKWTKLPFRNNFPSYFWFMKKIFFLLLAVSPLAVFAQRDREKTDSVATLVRQYFNRKDAAKLYELTGEQFRKAVPADKFAEVGNTNLFPLGEMQEPRFVGLANGVSKYKVDLPGLSMAMFLGLDEKDKLQTFLFREYVDETIKKDKVASSNALATPLDKEVDKAVQPYISPMAAKGLSIGILKDGQMFFYGYGETAKDSGKLPNEQTIFEIGSITKTFTAVLLADAVNRGMIKLDDPVQKYLPDSIPPLTFEGVPVTIKMLSNHSSAIPRMPSNFDESVSDPLNPYKAYTEKQLFRFYKTLRLNRKPGLRYEYSNLAVATLGLILERLYKRSFEQLVMEKITLPLKMNSTRQFLRKADSAAFAKGYNDNGRYNGQWDFKVFAPAGALRSTAADMLLYAKANLGEAPAALQKAMQLSHAVSFTDGTSKTGLGWHYIKPGEDEVLFHNGGTGGYRSYLAINKNKKLAVVILSNTAVGTESVGDELMKWLEKN